MKTNLSPQLASFLASACEGTNDVQFYLVDLVTFTLLNGVVLRLTTAEIDITYNGHTYSSMGPYLTRSKTRQSVGLEADEVEIDMYCDPTNQLYAQPILSAIALGLFDNAQVQVDRLYMQTPTDLSLGAIIWFKGQVSDVPEIARTHAKLTVRDKKELLNTNLPRNLYCPGCRHVLGDAGCTINLSNYSFTGTVTDGSNASVLKTTLTQPGPVAAPAAPIALTDVENNNQTDLTPAIYYVVYTYVTALGESLPSPEGAGHYISNNQHVLRAGPVTLPAGVLSWNLYAATVPGEEQLQASGLLSGDTWTMNGNGLLVGQTGPPQIPTGGYFTQGTILFTSGPNAGVSRFISDYGSSGTGVVTVLPPLPYAPQPGDTFVATAGCDRQMATCLNKFNNLAHFGGMPFIPAPELGA
ncbi:MAG TPA: DUF2163 domain-containing protein [Bryobacteraceae bacterium]|nr:DUF2163 domain-containing protein [Bryobacteraceae bacterium]